MDRLSIYRTHKDVFLPKFATKGSACFDLAFQAAGKTSYMGYNNYNTQFNRELVGGRIVVMPGDRILVPTGYIFDIPEGYSVRIHPRSGLSLKSGLVLANAEAVIDSDYTQETMVMITNTSMNQITLYDGDRIAQAEMVKCEEYNLWEINAPPGQKTDRVGGLGSTGVTTFVYNPDPAKSTVVEQETEQPIKRGRGRPRKDGTPAQPRKQVAHHPV